MSADGLSGAGRDVDWTRVNAVVAGLGTSGFAAADGLLELGAHVIVLDDSESDSNADKGRLLEVLDADVRLGPGASAALPEGTDLVVTSPGWRPTAPLLKAAAVTGIPIWGEVELAWRMQPADRRIPWLGITGTNGKTTTVQMLEAMLLADGKRAAAVGNVGRPVTEAVLDDTEYDVLALELSSFQLHWMSTVRLHSAVVLNLEADHLEWYADSESWGKLGWPSRPPMEAYGADKARIFSGVTHACVYNVADPATERMVEEADVTEGARAVGFTLGTPSVSMIGVVDDLIVDRAFIPRRRDSAIEIAKLSDITPFAPHNVANALAAAALARSFGVSHAAVGAGLRNLTLGGHRIQTVTSQGGITWVDDSKATNPHAAGASLRSFDSIVWIAGGQAKGTTFDDLIQANASKLRGAVLLGVDRGVVRASLSRHAPDVPVVVIDATDTGAMQQVVRAAASLAKPGDTVLLAPGCASKDMYTGYDARGDAFADAVRDLLAEKPSGAA